MATILDRIAGRASPKTVIAGHHNTKYDSILLLIQIIDFKK